MESSEEKTSLEETYKGVTKASNIGQSQGTVKMNSAHTAITGAPVPSRNQGASSMKNEVAKRKASSQVPKLAQKTTQGTTITRNCLRPSVY